MNMITGLKITSMMMKCEEKRKSAIDNMKYKMYDGAFKITVTDTVQRQSLVCGTVYCRKEDIIQCIGNYAVFLSVIGLHINN